jgi:glycosyltransferase involved in cell wall biosynthesis
MKFILGIDASRNRSGGAIEYLKAILIDVDFDRYQFKEVHVWANENLCKQLPNYPWLIKHSPSILNKNILFQLLWQLFILPKKFKEAKCNCLFITDASTLFVHNNSIVLSQDILSYDKALMTSLKWGKQKLRLILIYFLQNNAFNKSKGVIFLTNYARTEIMRHCGYLKSTICIPHASSFTKRKVDNHEKLLLKKEIKIVYVSPFFEYKNQMNLVKAIIYLRTLYTNICLTLVGDFNSAYGNKVLTLVKKNDPDFNYFNFVGSLLHDEVQELLLESDIFIFPSSCETFGIALLEAMQLGLPIASSAMSSMPETLKDSAMFFNPHDVSSIINALETIILDDELRINLALKAKARAEYYSWKSTSNKTFGYINEICLKSLK